MLLAEHAIPYTELDIEKSKEAREQHAQFISTGGVLVLVVRNTVIEGYNKEGILNALYQP